MIAIFYNTIFIQNSLNGGKYAVWKGEAAAAVAFAVTCLQKLPVAKCPLAIKSLILHLFPTIFFLFLCHFFVFGLVIVVVKATATATIARFVW